MSKRFRRAFRDKLCRYRSCCFCLCCPHLVIIGGPQTHADHSFAGHPEESQSTMTRQRTFKQQQHEPYSRNQQHSVRNSQPKKELPLVLKTGKKYSFSFENLFNLIIKLQTLNIES